MQVNKTLILFNQNRPKNPRRGVGRSPKKETRREKILGFVCVHKRCETLTLDLVYILDESWSTRQAWVGLPLPLFDRPWTPRGVPEPS